jgi:hypothetical protein
LPGGTTKGGTILALTYIAAFVVLWHCAQFALVDCALAWIAVSEGMFENLTWSWHFSQPALAENGM